MSYLTVLTKHARDNGLEWDGRASVPKLIKLLSDSDIDVPDDPGSGFAAEFSALQDNFGKLGKLSVRLKGIKDRDEKKRIRDGYSIGINRVKKAAKALKLELLERGDKEDYFKVLKWERSRRLIDVNDEYALNDYEQSQIKDRCLCVSKTPVAIPAQVDEEYPYFKEWYDSEERQCYMYTVYIKYIKAPEDQIGKALAWDIENGYKPDKSEYPKEKVLWRRHTWRESEFKRYFKVDDDKLLESLYE